MRSCKSPVPCCACYPTCGWVDDLRVAGGRMMMTLSSGEKTGIWADSEASDCIIWQSEVHGCKRAAAFGLGHAPCLCALEMTLGDAYTKRRYFTSISSICSIESSLDSCLCTDFRSFGLGLVYCALRPFLRSSEIQNESMG